MTFHISTALLVAVGIILCILAFKWLFADWIDKRNMRWAKRKHKQGYFAPPKSFKPVDLHLEPLHMSMVASALLRKRTDDEPMQDYEVELLNKVVQAYREGAEPLPEADKKLAIAVMKQYRHLLDASMTFMVKGIRD